MQKPFIKFEKNGVKGRVVTNPDFVSGVYICIYEDNNPVTQFAVSHKGFKSQWGKLKKAIQKEGHTITESCDTYEKKQELVNK